MYVTIDTEMDADIHWEKNFPAKYTSVIQGIPMYLRPIWDMYHVSPIYFVSPEVLEDSGCVSVLKEEVRRGAVIGAHLHPECIEPCARQEFRGEFACSAYPRDIEKKKIENLTALIEKRLGVRPVWYRAGRFGADADTLNSLIELGYQYDSSFTPFIDWSGKGGVDHSHTPLRAYDVDGEAGGHLREVPVTILGKRFGFLGALLPNKWYFYRWLRPSLMTLAELRRVIRQAEKQDIRQIVMMFHSVEIMVNTSPYVRSTAMQKYYLYRLREAVRYAVSCGYTCNLTNTED